MLILEKVKRTLEQKTRIDNFVAGYVDHSDLIVRVEVIVPPLLSPSKSLERSR